MMGLLFHSLGRGSQDIDKSLDIERYPNEPLELVDIRIGARSVKGEIKTKLRKGNEGLDDLKFGEKDNWHKRMLVRLRNVSGQPISESGHTFTLGP